MQVAAMRPEFCLDTSSRIGYRLVEGANRMQVVTMRLEFHLENFVIKLDTQGCENEVTDT